MRHDREHDPAAPGDADQLASRDDIWGVAAVERQPTGVAVASYLLVPRWVAAQWPLSRPRYVGRDLTWQA